MAYGIGLISAFIIIEKSKNLSTSIRSLIIILFIFTFSWHGTIKYSIWRGLENYYSGNFNTSIMHLERTTNIYPKKIGRFHILLSEMYLKENDIEDALKHALIAKEINPNHKGPNELLNIINSIKN